MTKNSIVGLIVAILVGGAAQAADDALQLNDLDYYEATGVNVVVFSNWYDGLFSDSKISGIELIHHGVRTATNGDVRLDATPEQWDRIPEFVEKKVDRNTGTVEAFLRYPDFDFDYSIRAEPANTGLRISVNLPKPLPAELEGKAGLNLEFLPAAYFEKSWILDDASGLFPLYPTGRKEQNDRVEPDPIAAGRSLVLAPESAERRVTIESKDVELTLFDGRTKAQNGWFVVRSLLPSEQTGTVLEWTIAANSIDDWLRTPVIGHSQVGYHPAQHKVAVIELDAKDDRELEARLVRIGSDGNRDTVRQSAPEPWGKYKRYQYRLFDVSDVREEGLYVFEYGDERTAPFRIASDIYADIWHATLDVFFPVQMDHVLVNEAYRVWHGASHLDDALQAPVNHVHFDLYAQGPTTDTPYEPGEHIPGLNVGGWYDAGDYDIRTQSQYGTVISLVQTWETFRPERDTTLVDYERKYVDIHVPDGKPDILQQIEHGAIALLAQHEAVGHAIHGIIVPTLEQYTHLGDGLTMTDNLVYDPDLGALESDGLRSGVADDRWAFTSESSALNFGSAAGLAAASRALRGYNDELADDCLDTAIEVWEKEQAKDEPDLYRHGNTTGGPLATEELRAAIELLVATGDDKYADRIRDYLPEIEERFPTHATVAVRALPYMDDTFAASIRDFTLAHRERLDEIAGQNPYGVLITERGWAGNGAIIGMANTNYQLHKAFPDIITAEDVLSGLNYILGTHPGSDISFVSGVGAESKKVAYGMNRADFSFIAGGIVPGVLILKPDFPENKEDWPFLWGENEYVIPMGAIYLYLAHAARDLMNFEQ
jgi:endoglucanase